MANDSTIRMILAGAGRIGVMHGRNIANRIPSMDLAAVVEPEPSEEVRDWTSSIGVPIYGDFGAAVSAVDAHAVLIAAPTDLHEPIVTQAAESGLHILCEKPVAPDIPAARRVVQAASKANVLLQIGFNRRFDHNSMAIRRAVATGRIGNIEIVQVTSRDPAPPGIDYIRRSGGLFMDMMIHDFDMARFLTGDDVAEVYTTGANLVDPEIGDARDIDTAVVSLRFKHGAIGMIENSRRANYGYDQRAEIHGSLGSVASRNDTPSSVVLQNSVGVHTEKPLYFFIERYEKSFIAELEAFASAIRNGSPPEISGSDGLEAMRIAAACAVSLREHRPVRLEEID